MDLGKSRLFQISDVQFQFTWLVQLVATTLDVRAELTACDTTIAALRQQAAELSKQVVDIYPTWQLRRPFQRP